MTDAELVDLLHEVQREIEAGRIARASFALGMIVERLGREGTDQPPGAPEPEAEAGSEAGSEAEAHR